MPRVKFASTNRKHYPDLGSDALSVRNFCARFSDVILRGNRLWPRETSAVFQAKVDVTRDDSQRRFLTQHSVATLFQIVTTLFQHCNAVINLVPRVISYASHRARGDRTWDEVALWCAKKSSLRIVSCNITLRFRLKMFFKIVITQVCPSLFITIKYSHYPANSNR